MKEKVRKQLTKRQLLKKLRELQQDPDKERRHSEADDALLDFIWDEKVSEEYEKIGGWYA